ncbi:MAG: M48 family metallopeptidase [bacterium]|nr:M48 family metallopeptidase [bacterium]
MGQRTPFVLGAVIAASGCATIPMQDVRISTDQAAQRRVWRLGEYLVETAARGGQVAEVEWRFAVLDDQRFSAHASHNGIVIINQAFAELFRTDELACVLGHEIGHVVKRHIRRGNTASATTAGVVLVGTIATIPFAPWWVPLSVFFGGDAVRDVGVAAYSRSLEEEADAFAVWLTIASGYPPDACERALTRMARQFPHRQSWISATLSATHPDIDDRIAFMRREAARYKR